jgi:hypothetical protein
MVAALLREHAVGRSEGPSLARLAFGLAEAGGLFCVVTSKTFPPQPTDHEDSPTLLFSFKTASCLEQVLVESSSFCQTNEKTHDA